MEFDMRRMAAPDRYKILGSTITPRPIAWITSLSTEGRVNAAPYSFFNCMGHEPPILAIGMLRHPEDRFKDTPANILATGEFVVHLVSEAVAPQMNITCIDAPPGVDELALAGLDTLPSTAVRPPRIATAPVAFECRLHTAVTTGPRQAIILGEVLVAHVRDDAILDAARHHVDTPALGLIGRMHGGGWYARTTDLFSIDRPSWQDWAPEHPEAVARARPDAASGPAD